MFFAATVAVSHCFVSAAPLASADLSSSSASADQSRLLGVVILSRHGNRSLLKDNPTLERETSSTWPKWQVPTGYLTDRGRKQMIATGGYYHEKFTRDGLLTGDDAEEVKHAWFHTNSIQRTIQSGAALAEGLFPSTTTTIHFVAPGVKDALFYGASVDDVMTTASISGRIGNNVPALAQSMNPQFDLIERALRQPGLYARTLSSIALAGTMADNFMCEYCEGLPASQFAFGRANVEDLREMLKLLALDFDLKCRTPYLAQRHMSNLVGHIVATLESIATGKMDSARFGDADDKLCVIVGHDSTLSSVAGLLHLDWVLPDTGRNLCPPGGALIFEVRTRMDNDGSPQQPVVRVYYASQTLAQLHDNVKPSLANPPSIAPIFVPGSSQASTSYDSPLTSFLRVARQSVDPSLVVTIDDGPQDTAKTADSEKVPMRGL